MIETLEMRPAVTRAPRPRRQRLASTPQLDLSYSQAKPILTRQWNTLHMALIGCGGTGSWLAPSVARLAAVLREAGKTVHVTFVDGDRVEPKNIPRQQFCEAELGSNKAQALALRYGTAWGIDIGAVPEMFSSVKAVKYLPAPWHDRLLVIIGCVDNAAARSEISMLQSLYNSTKQIAGSDAGRAPGTWWLDCGNADDSGQVLIGTSPNHKDLAGAFDNSLCWRLPSPALQRPELLVPRPEEALDASKRLSCAELTMLNYQALTINRTVATIADSYLWRLLLKGNLKRFATVADDEAGVQKSYYTTPEAVAASVGKTPEIFTKSK